MLPGRLDSRLHVRIETARSKPDLHCRRAHEIVAVGPDILATRWDDEKLRAFPFLRPGLPDVRQWPLPDIKDASRSRGRGQVDQEWTLFFHVPEAENVKGGDVRCEHPCLVLQ